MMTRRKDNQKYKIIEEEDCIDDFGTFNNQKELRHQNTQMRIAYIVIGGYILIELLCLLAGCLGMNIQIYETHISGLRLLTGTVIGYYFGSKSQ